MTYKRRLLDALFWRIGTSQLSSIVTDIATVDALGMCIYISPLSIMHKNDLQTGRMCYHIGVGFDVARSTILGNAKASKRGTGNGYVPTLFFVL